MKIHINRFNQKNHLYSKLMTSKAELYEIPKPPPPLTSKVLLAHKEGKIC